MSIIENRGLNGDSAPTAEHEAAAKELIERRSVVTQELGRITLDGLSAEDLIEGSGYTMEDMAEDVEAYSAEHFSTLGNGLDWDDVRNLHVNGSWTSVNPGDFYNPPGNHARTLPSGLVEV